MKKLHFIVKFIVAFIVATFAVALCIRYDASDKVVICAYFGVTILTMLALGAFDEREESKHDSIRHYDGRRNYGQAAVFIGTACLFMGTPEQCEDVADDLWHHGQQARVEMLTGDEVDFNIL